MTAVGERVACKTSQGSDTQRARLGWKPSSSSLRAGAEWQSLWRRSRGHSKMVRGSALGWPVSHPLCTVTPLWGHREIQQRHLSLGEARWGWEKDLEALQEGEVGKEGCPSPRPDTV